MDEERLVGNKWRIVRLLGRGAMGRVYEVRHKQLPLRKALKQLHAELAEDAAIEKRFVEEARRGAALDHPNIVRVADIDFDEGHGPYIVMDLVEGATLGQKIQEGERFDYQTTLRIGIEMASALDCAHRLGVIHRDIKPANVLLEAKTGQAKLTDFGIAKQVGETSDMSLTGTGLYVGTVRYSSREQLRNAKDVTIDGRADIYSLGVVLYEMLSGKRFLEDCSEFEIASRVGFDPEWKPELPFPEEPPARFRALLERCLAPERDDRIESATQLMAELEACRTGMPSTSEPEVEVEAGDMPTRIAAAGTEKRKGVSAFSVERLQQLRAELNEDAAEYEALLRALKDLGKTPNEALDLADISRMLSEVEDLESRGQLTKGQEDLSGIRQTLLKQSDEVRIRLAEEIGTRTRALDDEWSRIAQPSIEARERYLETAGEIARASEAQDWMSCSALIRELSGIVTRARDAAALSEMVDSPTHVGSPVGHAGPTSMEPQPDVVTLDEELPKAKKGNAAAAGAGAVVALAVLAGVAYFVWVGPPPSKEGPAPRAVEQDAPKAAEAPKPAAEAPKPKEPAEKKAEGPTAAQQAKFREHIELARFFMDRGEYADALEELDGALAAIPGNPEATKMRASVVQAQKVEESLFGAGSE